MTASVVTPSFTLHDLHARAKHADELLARGRFPEALHCYLKAVESRQRELAQLGAHWTAGDALVVERLVDLSILAGRYDAAADLLLGLEGPIRSAGNVFAADYVAVKRAHLLVGSGDARQAFETLCALSPSIGNPLRFDLSGPGLERWHRGLSWSGVDEESSNALGVRLLLVMGSILAANGQYADAIRCLEQARTSAESSPSDTTRAAASHATLALASARLEKGDLTGCEDELRPLSDVLDSARATPECIQYHELTGRLCQLRGRYSQAVDAYQHVVEASERLGFARARGAARLNLAHMLLALNQTRDARRHLGHAREDAGVDPGLDLRVNMLEKLVAARRRPLSDEVAIAPSVWQLWRDRDPLAGLETSDETEGEDSDELEDPLCLPQAASFLTFFEDRALAVQWRLSQGAAAQAAELADWMQDSFGQTDSRLILTRLQMLRGLVRYYGNRLEEAECSVESACERLAALELLPELWQAKRVLCWCRERLGRSAEACEQAAAEAQETLDLLSGSLSGSARSAFLVNKWTADEESLAGELDAIARVARNARSGPWWQRVSNRLAMIRRVAALLERLERHKRISDAEFTGMHVTRQPSASSKGIPWRRLFGRSLRGAEIAFLVLPDRVVAIQTSFGRIGIGVSAVGRGQLRELVAEWYRTVDRMGSVRDLEPGVREEWQHTFRGVQQRTLDRLGAALQLPELLDGLPGRIRSLAISPDDSLHGFPFAVLRVAGTALPERFAVSMASGAATRGPGRVRSHHKRALLVGVSRGTQDVPPLPNTAVELSRIAPRLQSQGFQVERREDDDASKSALLAELPRTDLLHAACHGIFRPDRPGDSGLLLMPRPGRVETLSLAEFMQLDLARMRHATLSSCWSADSFVLPGRRIISLPDTLTRAGVDSVLACLWPVDDALVVHFASRFYHHLHRHRRDEALRLTQCECLRGELPGGNDDTLDARSPVFWAGFSLYGSGGRL